MTSLQKTQDPGPEAFKYGTYQNQLYGAGMLRGERPAVTTDPNKLEEQAKEHMNVSGFNYVAGGAGERATMDSNRLAFRQWKIIPRMLRNATYRDLRVELFGQSYPSPIVCAPVGVQELYHPDAETGVAEVAAQIGVPYCASTASSRSLEEMAAANDKGAASRDEAQGQKGQRWFQLYWPDTEEVTESLLDRAKDNGYDVLLVTLDTWALAWRPWDLDKAYIPFFIGLGCQIGFSDPVFRRKYKEKTGKEPEEDVNNASMAWLGNIFSGRARGWEDLAHLRAHWKGPILLKGIQSVEDAIKAHECGMDGIVVSNHGGRQLDGAIGSLEVLPEIADAVKGLKSTQGHDFTVLFDSGIRTGVDVIKALCLGAKAVLVGRPWVYGLGINGKHGSKQVLRGILNDIDQSMGLGGMTEIAHCTRSMVRRVQYGGDLATSS